MFEAKATRCFLLAERINPRDCQVDLIQKAKGINGIWEQYSHEPNIASPRFADTTNAMTNLKSTNAARRIQQGNAALQLMDDTLSTQDF